MMSDLLTPGGRLCVPDSVENPPVTENGMLDKGPKLLDSQLKACSIEYGGDNWWNSDPLVEQVLKFVIPVFESALPDCQALFLFDNATSHSAYSNDTL